MPRLRLAAFFPIHNPGTWNAYTCLSLCEGMRDDDLDIELHVPSSDPPGRRVFTRDAVPSWLKGVCYRLDPHGGLAAAALRERFRRALKRADAAYMWPGSRDGTAVAEDVKRAGLPLFMESMNCHQATAKPILDRAYRDAGLAPSHTITEIAIGKERSQLALADWIFSPSPMVEKSLLADGVPARKILSTSYGWGPERMRIVPHSRQRSEEPTFIFVGTLDVRKGAHLLIDAWAAAGVRGRLELCGKISPEVRELSGKHLGRPDVSAPGHVDDIGSVYARAEVFALPTYEEGGPLVTYEAAAHGLAILTTPMGAGALVRDGIEGIVCEPEDRDGWIRALRQLASDRELRERLGAAAQARAQEFTWQQVGARRRALVREAMGNRRS